MKQQKLNIKLGQEVYVWDRNEEDKVIGLFLKKEAHLYFVIREHNGFMYPEGFYNCETKD